MGNQDVNAALWRRDAYHYTPVHRWTLHPNGPCSDAAGFHSSNRVRNIYRKTSRCSIDWGVSVILPFPNQLRFMVIPFPSQVFWHLTPPYPHWWMLRSEEEDKQILYLHIFRKRFHNHFLKCLLFAPIFPSARSSILFFKTNFPQIIEKPIFSNCDIDSFH